jgi:hypothetical protein
MPGIRMPSPAEAFAHHIEDAHQLVKLVHALTNTRTRKMRVELRERLCDTLRIPIRYRDELECIDSTDVFLVFRPGSAIEPGDLLDLRALLRQAVVAACAALETYLGDKVMERVGPLLHESDSLTPRLKEIPLNLGQWVLIETTYQRHGAGLRNQIVGPYVREKASTASSSVGQLLSMIGIDGWAAKVDSKRGVARGATLEFLDRITQRRNKIAHEADRQGRGRADLTPAEVEEDLKALASVVDAIESLIGPTSPAGAPA